ncbi:MAG: hypothetical protein E6K60_02600 [Nitrospirae bacterium]|nr:MAG: hypothetical protein E6K60_02600 [Nitrospirota bacterium]
MKGDLAKHIATQLNLRADIVRVVLMARGSPHEKKKVLADAGVDRALRDRIVNAARAFLHEELLRLDAQHHPPRKVRDRRPHRRT